MKNLKLVALLSLMAATATSAHATYCNNGATNYPKCNNHQPPPPPPPPPPANPPSAVPSLTSQASSASTAVSTSTSNATNSAIQSQQQEQSQLNNQSVQGSGNSDLSLVDSSSSRSSMWVFPAPVFTPPLPHISCPGASVEQQATAIGWNLFSHASSRVDTRDCTAITIYNSYVSTCKYKSAQQVLDLLTEKILPGYQRTDILLADLTKQECDALRIVKPLPQTQTQVTYLQIYKMPTRHIKRSCAKGQKLNSKGQCYPVAKPRPCKVEKPVCEAAPAPAPKPNQ